MPERWQKRCLDVKLRLGVALFLFDLPDAVIQAARRWAAGALAIFVIHAAMAGAHEQAGLWKPFDWAAQVRAIDGEDVELIFKIVVAAQVADVDSGLSRDAVPGLGQRVVGRLDDFEPGFALGESADRAERDPGLFFSTRHGGRQITDTRNG